jgi:peptidyl-prolyl cis-trans isomerase C
LKKSICLLFIALLLFTAAGCNRGEETKKIKASEETQATGPQTIPQAIPQATPQATPPATTAPLAPATSKTSPNDVIAEVDGFKLTRAQLDLEVKKKMQEMQGKIPADKITQATAALRKELVDDFVVRTLLLNEANRRKIIATDKEVADRLNSMKESLPPGATMEEFLKKSGVSSEQLRQEITLGIRISKLVNTTKTAKATPSEKEIQQFYKNNKEKFRMPESVHARHILIAKTAGEDEKSKTAKHEKAENLRKQLLAGSDFAEVAKANSDCPSKAQGGDLGTFSKGQMVKPFENAAFSQKKNEIGPVVETDFGYHIIQVIDHQPSKIQSLDKETKLKISAFLKQKKNYEAFNEIMQGLKTKAHIVVSEK